MKLNTAILLLLIYCVLPAAEMRHNDNGKEEECKLFYRLEYEAFAHWKLNCYTNDDCKIKWHIPSNIDCIEKVNDPPDQIIQLSNCIDHDVRFSCEALSENSTTILLAHFVYKTDVFTAEWSRSRTANRSAEWSRSRTANRSAEWSRSRTANRSVEWSRSRTANRSSSTTIFRSTSRNDILSNSDISIMSTPNIIHSEDIIVSTTSVSPLISIPGFTLSSNTYDQLETNTAKDHTNSFIINNTITTSTTVLAALTSLSNCSVTVQFHYFHHIIYSGVIAILLCSIFVLLLLGTIFCFKKSKKHKPAPPVTNNLQSAIPNPILMLNSKESLQVDNPLLSHEYASLKPLTHLQDQQHQYFTLVGQEAAPYLIPLGKNSHQYSNVVLRDDILTSQEPRFQIIGSPISVNNVDGPVTEGEHLYTEVCPEN